MIYIGTNSIYFFLYREVPCWLSKYGRMINGTGKESCLQCCLLNIITTLVIKTPDNSFSITKINVVLSTK